MSTINASVYRNTRFELRSVTQEANAFVLVCSERALAPVVAPETGHAAARRTPPIEVHESRFTDEEMLQVHAVLEMLERKAADVVATIEADPSRVLAAAIEAENRLTKARAEAAKLEADTARKRAENA